MEAHALIQFGIVTAWALLLFNAVRLRLIWKYRLVFAMILTSMAGVVLMFCLSNLFDVPNMAYNWALVGKVLVTEGLTAAVLLQICAISEEISFRRDWHLILIPFFLVCVVLLDNTEIWFFARLCTGIKLAVTYLGVATILRTARRKSLQLGWNLKMVLVAVTVPSVFSHLMFNSHLLGILPRQEGVLWLAGVGLAAWIILAVGMMEYSPPVILSDHEPGQLNAGFAKQATSTRNLG